MPLDTENNKGETAIWHALGKTFGERGVFGGLIYLLGMTLLILLGILCFGAMFLLPIQAVAEGWHWIQFAEWRNYDWFWLLDADHSVGLVNTGLDGLDMIVNTVGDWWVSLIPAVVGTVGYLAITGDLT